MLLTPAPAPPAGEGYVHEAKLDGWRFCAEATDGRVRLWSRGGHDWAPKLPELESLAALGDIVLDGEMVVATPDGRADFELLTTRLNRRPGDPTPGPPASLYVFDILRHHGQDVRHRPWSQRRAILDDLQLAERTEGAARPTVVSADGNAMHQATADIGAEGTVSKAVRSLYRGGRRSRFWLKTKHSRTGNFQVAGWRPSTASRPGGLILVENDHPVAVATLAIADQDRRNLVDLLHRYGRQHPTGTVTIADDCITATVRYTSRTPTNGHLREAFVLAVRPAANSLFPGSGGEERPGSTNIEGLELGAGDP
jgi:ATP-dependent DNA ligase